MQYSDVSMDIKSKVLTTLFPIDAQYDAKKMSFSCISYAIRFILIKVEQYTTNLEKWMRTTRDIYVIVFRWQKK
jgi:hypothetical protein